MKLSFSVLCLPLLLFHTPFSLARNRGGGGLGKGIGNKKSPNTNRGGTNTNTGNKNNQGSQGGYPKQIGQNNQGGFPPQSGRPGQPGSYPKQQGGRGYYPGRGSPYGAGYGQGGQGGYGGYPGGYINKNPNNQILSPHYGGSFGYGGYGGRGGSPFSHSVQAMGIQPNAKSRGFGRSAVMAAAGGAMAGMALGYGLGRFPRPPFQFHSSQEEYYYNNYMYRKYGTQSTDTNDYSRDYSYNSVPQTFDGYMDSCMRRRDVLTAESQKPKNNPAVTTATTVAASASDADAGSNATETNRTAAESSSTSTLSNLRPANQPEAGPVSPAPRSVGTAEDDDTVSVVEIGYPALIEQLKARKCLERYMAFSEKYLKRQTGGAEGLEMGLRGLLAVITSTILMLLH
ncbi:uncharacterized protein [Embiotoca jacksoni]|uniref:uncharacterized protein n=1 Tax=Embiotoca jacksoni TaxID=100190 RepID=UPI003704520C